MGQQLQHRNTHQQLYKLYTFPTTTLIGIRYNSLLSPPPPPRTTYTTFDVLFFPFKFRVTNVFFLCLLDREKSVIIGRDAPQRKERTAIGVFNELLLVHTLAVCV
jgi:hypothetical protein